MLQILTPRLLLLLPLQVRLKAVRAVSCTVRGHVHLMQTLRETPDGLARVVACVGAEGTDADGFHPRLSTKAAFLIRALCEEDPAFVGPFLRAGVVPAVAGALQLTEDDMFWEQALACACEPTVCILLAMGCLVVP